MTNKHSGFDLGLRAIALATVLAACPATAEIFMGIGIAEGADSSSAAGISGDGRVITGGSGWDGLVWSEEEGLTVLSAVERGLASPPQVGVTSASWDGSVLVGVMTTGPSLLFEATRWIDLQPEVLGVPATTFTLASDISGDGSVIVGLPFHRSEADGLRVFEDLGFAGVSRDGTTAVGIRADGLTEAIAWRADTGVIALGGFPDGETIVRSEAIAASADGSVVVGHATVPGTRTRPFRWTAETGILRLRDAAGDPIRGRIGDVSDDGQIAVGFAVNLGAMVWDPLNGAQSLEAYLEAEHGVDLTGWDLDYARGISADGRILVGTGTNPQGDEEGWRVELPYLPGHLARLDFRPFSRHNRVRIDSRAWIQVGLFGDASLDVTELDPLAVALGPGEAAPIWAGWLWDLDRDGHLDRILTFRARDLGLALGDTEVCLTGRTEPGMPFAACDEVETQLGCHRGAPHGLAVSALLLLALGRFRSGVSRR